MGRRQQGEHHHEHRRRSLPFLGILDGRPRVTRRRSREHHATRNGNVNEVTVAFVGVPDRDGRVRIRQVSFTSSSTLP
jgi:hypothetical protein